jgi:hypothetical protein
MEYEKLVENYKLAWKDREKSHIQEMIRRSILLENKREKYIKINGCVEGEFIIIRRAREEHECHECNMPIIKGLFYVEDHLKYYVSHHRGGWNKFYTNKICLNCWKGPLPKY